MTTTYYQKTPKRIMQIISKISLIKKKIKDEKRSEKNIEI